MGTDNLKYNRPLSREQFKNYINLDLNEKIEISKEIIEEFYENVNKNSDEKIYIASSFGKDSVVLIDLVREIYPEIPIIHSDTGLELKGVYETKKLYDNVLTVHPLKEMDEIIKEYGYILPIGKRKTTTLRRARDFIKKEKYDNVSFKKLAGKGKFGKGSLFNEESALKYIVCPFKISEKCDELLKQKPLSQFAKKNGYKYYYRGITYDESIRRKSILMKKGFNNMESNSSPLGHWNTSEILEYISAKKISYGDYYGEIIKKEDGTYDTTLFKRNGCYCCPCGSHLEKEPNRYQLLYYYDNNAWQHTINELGFGKVLDYFEIPYYPNDSKLDETNMKLDEYFREEEI